MWRAWACVSNVDNRVSDSHGLALFGERSKVYLHKIAAVRHAVGFERVIPVEIREVAPSRRRKASK